MANIIIPDLDLGDNQNYLHELTASEMKNAIGGGFTINVPTTESNKQFYELFDALQHRDGKPITINWGVNPSPSHPSSSDLFDKANNPF